MISLNIGDVTRCGRCPCAHFMMGGTGLDAQAQRLYFPKFFRPRKFYFSLSITRDICSMGKWWGGVLWGNRWWLLWALGAHLTFGLEALGIDAFPFTHSRRQNWTSKPWESRADALNSGSSKLHKIRNTGPGQLDNLPETQPWPMAKPDNSRALIGNSSFHQTAFL